MRNPLIHPSAVATIVLGLIQTPYTLAGEPVAVLSSGSKTYLEVAAEIEKQLANAGHAVTQIQFKKEGDKSKSAKSNSPNASRILSSKEAADKLASSDPKIVVSVGLTATAAALPAGPSKKIVFCMVANAADLPFFASAISSDASHILGVDANISPEENIEWIGKFEPKRKRLGILCSDRSKKTAQRLVEAARKDGVKAFTINARSDDFGKAIEQLSSKRCDGLVMIPDSRVYTVPSIRRVLLWSLRQNKPVWTFSAGIVKAGALSGKYSDAKHTAKVVVQLVSELESGGRPAPGLQHAPGINAAINERTAGKLEITLDRESLSKVTDRYGGSKQN